MRSGGSRECVPKRELGNEGKRPRKKRERKKPRAKPSCGQLCEASSQSNPVRYGLDAFCSSFPSSSLGTHWSPGSAWQGAKSRATYIHWVTSRTRCEAELRESAFPSGSLGTRGMRGNGDSPMDERRRLTYFRVIGSIIVGIFGTLISNVLVFVVLTSSAPRESEGARRVVTWPWEPHAIIAHILPVLLVYCAALTLFRSWQVRLSIMIIAAVTEFCWFQGSGAGLLRRDYIGKF